MEIISGSKVIEGPYAPIHSKRFHAWKNDYRPYPTLDAARSAAKSVANRCQCEVWIHRLANGRFMLGRQGTNPKSPKPLTNKEIFRAVQSRTSVVAWVTEKGLIFYNPDDTKKLTLPVGADRSFVGGIAKEMLEAGMDVPFLLVEGISGLAATDPEWDGQEMFHCQNPDCPNPVHSADENSYVNIWKRSPKPVNCE